MGKEKQLGFIILAIYGGILAGLLEVHGTAFLEHALPVFYGGTIPYAVCGHRLIRRDDQGDEIAASLLPGAFWRPLPWRLGWGYSGCCLDLIW